MPTGLSPNQLLRVPFIMRTITRLRSPGNTMCQYYGLGIAPRVNVQRITGNAGQYDIFDGTRSLAPFTAPGAPPVAMNRKPIGTQPITVPRQYNSIGIEDNQLFGTRDLGQPYSQPTPSRGENYFFRQIRFMKTRMENNHEFMCSHMFQGGWRLKPYAAGSSLLVLAEASDAATGSVLNDTLVPSDHKNQIGGIIGTSWDDPSANLVEQFNELDVRAARVNGRKITEIWLNGNTAKHLFTNSVIQGVAGAVNRIYDTLRPSREIKEGQEFPDTGYTVEFGGLPGRRFHVYNQGYVVPGTSESFSAQIDSANWKPFIPDNMAIMTPAPGDWCEMVEGSELAQYNLLEAGSRLVAGLGVGTERAIDPPRTDVKALYNGAPVITEPYAVYAATVVFTP